MTKHFCRALNCGMSFSTPKHRNDHQRIMHKTLVADTAILLLEKINKSNTKEALAKKVLKTPHKNFSYAEAKNIASLDTEDGKAVLQVMKDIVDTYFMHNEEHGVHHLLNVSEFKIK